MLSALSPSVYRVVSALKDRIRSGLYRENQWLPTERDLAAEFQVSRAIIRQALDELERGELLHRTAGCRPLIRRGNGPRPVAPESARRSVGMWISGDPTDIGGAMTARGIHRVLDPDLYRLVVANHRGASLDALIEAEAQALERFARDRDIAGLLLWYFGGDRNRPALDALRAAGIPLVFLDRRPPAGFDADYVGIHNERAARDAVAHLIRQGHRRIAHVTNTELASTVVERLTGYRQALAETGLPYRAEYVLPVPFLEMEGEAPEPLESALADSLLSLKDRPTAVFCVNDATAYHLFPTLEARGVRVPDDIAIAGFDDEARWRSGPSYLTTVRQPFEQIGAEAAWLLVERLEAGQTNTYRHVLLDAPLVVRASTARAARSETDRSYSAAQGR